MIPANLLPSNERWCVAGGYAACPALASDIDVWVYDVAIENLYTKRDELVEWFRPLALLWGWKVEVNNELLNATYYENGSISILKVATIETGRPGAKPIHLMVTDALAVTDILAAFDVSTHQVAIEGECVITGPGWTPPQDEPVRLLDNSNTPERLQRIAARFAPSPEPDGAPF